MFFNTQKEQYPWFSYSWFIIEKVQVLTYSNVEKVLIFLGYIRDLQHKGGIAIASKNKKTDAQESIFGVDRQAE